VGDAAFVITIDGPAGAGKSSTAREVARRLGYAHLDSGALYRAYTFAALRAGAVRPDGRVDPARIPEILAAPVEAEIRGRALRIRYAGRTLDRRLRTPAVTAAVSAVSAIPEVRRRVNETLRALARAHAGGIVCEGRDIGSQVYPEAPLKVFLTASAEERARRRLLERGEPVTPERLEAERRALTARDERDARRAASPFRRPPDALDLDTTHLTRDEQVARILAWARERGAPRTHGRTPRTHGGAPRTHGGGRPRGGRGARTRSAGRGRTRDGEGNSRGDSGPGAEA
jgi:cytidylate kinase